MQPYFKFTNPVIAQKRSLKALMVEPTLTTEKN